MIYFTLFLEFFKVGLFTFGGGYAMISILQNEFVEKNKETANLQKNCKTSSNSQKKS